MGPALGVETQEAPGSRSRNLPAAGQGCSQKAAVRRLQKSCCHLLAESTGMWILNFEPCKIIFIPRKDFVMPNLVSVRYYIIYTLGHKQRKRILRLFSVALFHLQRERGKTENGKWH